MALIITADTAITTSAMPAALGSLFSVALWWMNFIEWGKRQIRQMDVIRREQTLIRYGIIKARGFNGWGKAGSEADVSDSDTHTMELRQRYDALLRDPHTLVNRSVRLCRITTDDSHSKHK